MQPSDFIHSCYYFLCALGQKALFSLFIWFPINFQVSVSGTFFPAALSLLFKLLIHSLSRSQCFAWFYPMDEQFSIFFWLQFPLHNYKFIFFQGCNFIGHNFSKFHRLVESVPPLDWSSRENPVLVFVWWSWTPLSLFCFPLPSWHQNNRHHHFVIIFIQVTKKKSK